MGTSRGRVPQLDGLRGFAVAIVVWSHMWVGAKPEKRRLFPGTTSLSGGGFAGVQVFFVLSGFLITGILVRELDPGGQIRLRAFYARRFRRLVPALAIVVIAYTAYVLTVMRGDELRAGLGSAARAFYLENLDPLIRWIPSNEWLGHTWSLAVEEQFYLFWPLALLLLYRWFKTNLARSRVVLAAIVFVVLLRYAMVAVGLPVNEAMQWDALLAGCLLAFRPWTPPSWLTHSALAALIAVTAYAPLEVLASPHFFVVTVGLGYLCVAGATSVKLFLWRPLRYLGMISYGLYLWHGLLLRLALPVVPSIAASVLVAHASYKLIEQPIMERRWPLPRPLKPLSARR